MKLSNIDKQMIQYVKKKYHFRQIVPKILAIIDGNELPKKQELGREDCLYPAFVIHGGTY